MQEAINTLQPYIILLVVFGVTWGLKFLSAQFGFTIPTDTWLDALAYAIGVAVTALLNEYALHLPLFLQAYVPVLVQFVIVFLTALGIKSAANQSKATAKVVVAKFK